MEMFWFFCESLVLVILCCKQDKEVFGNVLECVFSCLLKVQEKLHLMTTSFISLESDYIRRKLPSSLKEGEPNLLLVPKGM